jgi:hypothetical protein
VSATPPIHRHDSSSIPHSLSFFAQHPKDKKARPPSSLPS